MNYTTLFNYYNEMYTNLNPDEEGLDAETIQTRKEKRQHLKEGGMSAEMANDFNGTTLSVDDINERISHLAEMSDSDLEKNFIDCDIKVVRNVLLKPVKQITDNAELYKRADNMINARQFLTHYIADKVVMTAEGEKFDRDVYDLVTSNTTEEIRKKRLEILNGNDVNAKKELFMSIMQNMENDIASLDLNSDLSDEYILENKEKLARLAPAAVIQRASRSFEQAYSVIFTDKEKENIKKVFDKGQNITWSFLSRISVIASPYYPSVDVRELSRLSVIRSRCDDVFPENDKVIHQTLLAADSFCETRHMTSLQHQIQTFADSHPEVKREEISLRITDDSGKTVILSPTKDPKKPNALISAKFGGIQYADAVALITPDKKYLADMDLSIDQSLRFESEKTLIEPVPGGLEGKAFAKDCADLLAEMNKADHWYQRSSDEFRETKKLLNAIASDKPMSRTTAGESSEKLFKYADDYIAKHSDRTLSTREKARMDIMVKISRTFHAKQEAIEKAHQKAANEHDNNRFASDDNRSKMSRQATDEYSLERVPHSINDVLMSSQDRMAAIKSDRAEQLENPDVTSAEEVTDNDADDFFRDTYGNRASYVIDKLNQVETANRDYLNKTFTGGSEINLSKLNLLGGVNACAALVKYAKGLKDNLPYNFDISRAVTELTISSMIKAEREANNPKYLTKANQPIIVGTFEKLVAQNRDIDVINVLKGTATINHICKDMSPEAVTDMLINHKEIQIAKAIKQELSPSALSKAVELERNRRMETEARKAEAEKIAGQQLP